MNFVEALKAMKNGANVKLPSWGGYWRWNPDKKTIIMHTKDGEDMDIRETLRVEYTLDNILSDEWQLADETNCPELGGEEFFSDLETKYGKEELGKVRMGIDNDVRLSVIYYPQINEYRGNIENQIVVNNYCF